MACRFVSAFARPHAAQAGTLPVCARIRHPLNSPHGDPVLRREIHPVALFNIIRFQELIELLQRHIYPLVAARMRMPLTKPLSILRPLVSWSSLPRNNFFLHKPALDNIVFHILITCKSFNLTCPFISLCSYKPLVCF